MKNFVTGDVYQVQVDNHLWMFEAESGAAVDLGMITEGTGDDNDLYKAPSVIENDNNRLIVAQDLNNPGEARIFELEAKTWSTQE